MVGTPTKIRTPSSPLAREPLSAGPAGRSPDVHSPNKMVRLNGARRGSRYSPPPNPDRPHVVVQAHVNDSPLAFRRKLGPNGTPSTPYLGPRRSPLAVNNQVPQSSSAARPGALYGQSSRVPQDVTRVPSATPAGRPSSMDETNDVPSKPNLTRRLEKKPQVAAYPANANDRHSSYLDRMAAISHPTGDPASPMLETANSATRGKPGMLGSQTPLIAASPALDYSGGLISLRPGTMPPSQQSRLPQTRPSTHAEPSSPMISSSANPAVTAGYPRRVSHSSRGLGVTAADLAEPQSPLISSADLSHARAAAPQRAPAVRIARPPAALPQPPSQMAHMHPHQVSFPQVIIHLVCLPSVYFNLFSFTQKCLYRSSFCSQVQRNPLRLCWIQQAALQSELGARFLDPVR